MQNDLPPTHRPPEIYDELEIWDEPPGKYLGAWIVLGAIVGLIIWATVVILAVTYYL